MLALNVDYEVLPDRLVTIKLPEAVRLGRDQLVIVLNENEAVTNITDASSKKLMQFAGCINTFNGIDGVEYQKKVRSEWN
jgi:hypothetical protein